MNLEKYFEIMHLTEKLKNSGSGYFLKNSGLNFKKFWIGVVEALFFENHFHYSYIFLTPFSDSLYLTFTFLLCSSHVLLRLVR